MLKIYKIKIGKEKSKYTIDIPDLLKVVYDEIGMVP